jgi:hypothetical protein
MSEAMKTVSSSRWNALVVGWALLGFVGCAGEKRVRDPQAGAAQQVAMDPALVALEKRPTWLFPADACPADVVPWYERKPGYLSEACVADLGVCVKRCELGEADGCYAAALRLQEIKADWRPSEAMFLRGCRLGIRSACTNRAAGIMTFEPERPGGDVCVAKTFEKTCEANDAWGCSMLGLCLFKGQGVARDLHRALEVLPKGCRHGEEDEACKAAVRLVKKIEEEIAAHPL